MNHDLQFFNSPTMLTSLCRSLSLSQKCFSCLVFVCMPQAAADNDIEIVELGVRSYIGLKERLGKRVIMNLCRLFLTTPSSEQIRSISPATT